MLRTLLVCLSVLTAIFASGAHAQGGPTVGGGSGTGAAGPATSDASAASPATGSAPALQLQPTQAPTITNRASPQDQGAPRPQQGRGTQDAPAPASAPASVAASVPVDTNDFQDFVAVSTGKVLPLFGYNLFQNVPSTFAPVENIPVTPDYTIGPGDELYIRAWGQVDVDFRTTVDRNGAIAIPRVGVINVSGIKYQELTAYVKTAVSRVFRNFELVVTMGNLRSMQIFVVGQARRPGTYTVSSLSTLVNAIFAAGGPSSRGSMRSIQLKRGNRTAANLDLYDLLLYGDKSRDVPLLPGDVIFFPPTGPVAALSGSVQNPAIFELKGESSIGKLIEWSGGLSTTAQTRLATIERIDARRTRVVDQLSLDPAGLARPLKDGDLVTVYSISPKFENAVTLRGNVAAALRYPFREGMRVRDLIPERDALIRPDYYLKKNLSVIAIDRRSAQQIRTEVRNLLSEINWDYALIERLNQADLTSTLIPFNLGKAILEGDSANNLALRAGDVVTIFSKTDITVPQSKQTQLVRLEGEFNHSGVYQALPGETLRQMIVRIGGLAPNAYLFAAEFTRESIREQQQKAYDETLNRLEKELQTQAVERSRNVLSPEDAEALKASAAAQQAVIARLRQLRPTGRIVLNLPEDTRPVDVPEVALEDGDRLFVPARPAMVNILGSVYSENAFLYRPDRGIADYLQLAGGTTKRADTSQTFVIRADGSAAGQSSSWLGLGGGAVSKILPGDTIVVPEDFERTTLTRSLKDWTQILYQFGLGAAAIKVIRN